MEFWQLKFVSLHSHRSSSINTNELTIRSSTQRLSHSLWSSPRRPSTTHPSPYQPLGRAIHGRSCDWGLDGSWIHVCQRHSGDSLHLVTRLGRLRTAHELAGHLHDISALLLCHEEAGHLEKKITMGCTAPTFCSLDDSDFTHHYPPDGRVHDFHSRAVCIPASWRSCEVIC